ncbi:MAG: dephospho-CoA kinase [Chromatiales bacterium]|nr:dephospho-CoA kinase [Chromatiales bacterium]
MSATDTPLRVGLTGGIASGKSTVAARFAALGIPVIDTDLIARELVKPGEPALAEIRRAFGEGVIAPNGTLDRAALRGRIFRDAAARKQLDQILHPKIRAATLAAAAAADGPWQLIVVPLLFEAGFDELVDRVLVVDCPEAVQQERLMARDGESVESAARILAAQLPRAERLARADDVLGNAGTPGELDASIASLDARYRALAASREGARRASGPYSR